MEVTPANEWNVIDFGAEVKTAGLITSVASVMQAGQAIMEIRPCGCWFVNLAQGRLVLTCRTHEEEVSRVCR